MAKVETQHPDPTDRGELLKSLEKWKQESKKQHGRFVRARRLYQRARKVIAKRRRQLKALRSRPVGKFLQKCLSHVGEHEVGYSNTGKNIDRWEAECGLHAQPYCALFLMYMYHHTVGTKLACAYAYTPNILNAARQGHDFEMVSWGHEKPGDWVLYNFGSSAPVQHVGTILRVLSGSKNYETVEGNTSPGTSGSQDNGGGVYLRQRHGYGVVAVVRPKYH